MNEQIDAYFQAWNAVVAAADLPTLRARARELGWDKLRLLSAGNDTFKYDLGSESDCSRMTLTGNSSVIR